jgi:hypothetical protein
VTHNAKSELGYFVQDFNFILTILCAGGGSSIRKDGSAGAEDTSSICVCDLAAHGADRS